MSLFTSVVLTILASPRPDPLAPRIGSIHRRQLTPLLGVLLAAAPIHCALAQAETPQVDAFGELLESSSMGTTLPQKEVPAMAPEVEADFARAFAENAKRPPEPPPPPMSEAGQAAFEAAFEESAQEELLQRAVPGEDGRFSAWALQLDLEPELDLATRRGDSFVTVQEYNQRLQPQLGTDLYEARRQALDAIIRKKLVAELARDAGFADRPEIQARMRRATEGLDTDDNGSDVGLSEYQISDAEAEAHFNAHRDAFRRPDPGIRALLAVRGSEAAAAELVSRINREPKSEELWLAPEPLSAYRLPQAVRDALFHADEGDLSRVVATPIGFYVARLVERNLFDRFRVRVVMVPTLAEASALRERLDAGASFESLVQPGPPKLLDVAELPAPVQEQVHGLDVGDVSDPIQTRLGVMLVKLEERWSEAPITAATVVLLGADAQAVVDRLNAGGDTPEGVSPQSVTGADLPEPVLAVARTLKRGVFSPPIATDLGVMTVRVDERHRDLYQSFAEAKPAVVRELQAQRIPDRDKREYYEQQRADFQRPEPEYMVDLLVSGGETDALSELRALAAADPAERTARFDAELPTRGFTEVTASSLPAPCADVAETLEPGVVSPVCESALGHFALRLREVREPAYQSFDDVAEEIGVLLAERAAEAAALEGVRKERERNLAITGAEERVLEDAYRAQLWKQTDTVSDSEAEAWWKRNGRTLFAGFGLDPQQIEEALANGGMDMKTLKLNVLQERLGERIDALYRSEQISVLDEMLKW